MLDQILGKVILPLFKGRLRQSLCGHGQPNVVTFEGLNKVLGHSITLWALHWSRDWFEPQHASKGTCITSDVALPRSGQVRPRKSDWISAIAPGGDVNDFVAHK
jgi:hypothetical protein